MRIISRFHFFLLLTLLLQLSQSAFPIQITTPQDSVFWAPMTINNITAWYASDGRQEAYHPKYKISGVSYPRKTVSTIFTSGFRYSGTLISDTISYGILNGAMYSTTMQQGAILGIKTGDAEDKFNGDIRIWRIRKDFATADLLRDAADTYNLLDNNVGFSNMQNLRAQYKKDWIEWPTERGAPFYDADSNGYYNPKFILNQFGIEVPDPNSDSPGMNNADQVIWSVCNDLDAPGRFPNVFTGVTSPMIGVELQITIWGYKDNPLLSNVLYKRCKLLYKGKKDTKPNSSLYVTLGIWSHVYLNRGEFDPSLGLGYVYNSTNVHPEYTILNLAPPAVGYDILGGNVNSYTIPSSTSTQLYVNNNSQATMKVGTSREINVALIIGQGADQLSSISALKNYDKIAQKSFDLNFKSEQKISAPNFTLSGYDGSVLIQWEKDTASVNKVEKYSNGKGNIFEGYNIYQMPTENAPRSQWKKIATYDLKNEITQIVQDQFNETSGRVEQVVVQNGKNSGIQRYLFLHSDSLRNRSLINGQTYFYSVSAYTYNSDLNGLYRSQESDMVIASIVPHAINPETILPYLPQDSLLNASKNIVGNNDARIGIKIIDPFSVTSGNFDFWYGITASVSNYTVVKDLPGPDYASIRTTLISANIIPRNVSEQFSKGNAVFTLNDSRDTLRYSIFVDSVKGLLSSIEIYFGAKNFNGSFVKSLPFSGKINNGVWTKYDLNNPLTDETVREFVSGLLYVAVKTSKYPNGEIRGQLFDGLLPRTDIPFADPATSGKIITTFSEVRMPIDGFSFFMSPAPVGFKSAKQIEPSVCSIISEPNNEGTYFIAGPGYSWAGYTPSESSIEFRFTTDTNWAIVNAPVPGKTYFVRVPFQIYQDTVRVWPVIYNKLFSDSAWNTNGNSFLNGKPTFDQLAIANAVDGAEVDISYYGLLLPDLRQIRTINKGRLINGVNHLAENITFVNLREDGIPPKAGTIIRLVPNKSIKYGDINRITLKTAQTKNKSVASAALHSINVFPNPYYGVNAFETSSLNRFVTFSHLPEKAVIKIFNLAGTYVRGYEKNDPSQFFKWDLKNEKGLFVASGLYIVYIEMDGIGKKILKLSIIMEDAHLQQF